MEEISMMLFQLSRVVRNFKCFGIAQRTRCCIPFTIFGRDTGGPWLVKGFKPSAIKGRCVLAVQGWQPFRLTGMTGQQILLLACSVSVTQSIRVCRSPSSGHKPAKLWADKLGAL